MRTDKLDAANVQLRVGPTPGPWHLNRAIRGRLYVEAEGPVVICDMQLEACVAATRGITEADARLIAAAPELLDALEDAHAVLLDVPGREAKVVLAKVYAAIAKAEGQVTP